MTNELFFQLLVHYLEGVAPTVALNMLACCGPHVPGYV